MKRACVIAALLASTGCSKILGLSDVTRSDGGTDDAPVDAIVAPPNTVVGHYYTRYTLPTVSDVPRDLSAIVVQALIPDPAQPSKYSVVNGTGKADGTFSISPVPDGVEYLLKLGGSYYVTTQHVIDIHFDTAVRGVPAPSPLNGSAFYDFNITGLTPVVNGPEGVFDEFEVDSFSLGYQGSLFAPSNNATSVATNYDWSTGFSIFGTALGYPDGAQSDDAWVLHYRPGTLMSTIKRAHPMRQLRGALQLSNVTLTQGAHVAQAAAMTPVNLTNTVQLSITRGTFDAGFDGYSSIGAPGIAGADVSLYAYPTANDDGLGGMLLDLNFDDWTRSTSLTETVNATYGDPFPTSWSRIMTLLYNRSRWLLLPGTTTPRASTTYGYLRAFPYTGGNPSLTPGLLPPGNVKIAGQAAGAGGKIPFDGTAPVTVSWNGVAAAKVYSISVQRVYANGAQTRITTAGSLMTTKTSVDLPAEMFTGGEFFAINVSAYQTPSDYASGQLGQNGVPYQLATYPGGMFRFSATCGNGSVDTNESCDASGESATCDVDCTARACGDGLRNATAGEACDTIKDTPGCDADCTMPVCGDGHVNLAAGEDCDDGNTTADGNGCSATCKLISTCGNGVVESLTEQCDPGAVGANTATCDSDCTTAFCGDGHLNTAKGETCDDGNQDDTDGCKSNCAP